MISVLRVNKTKSLVLLIAVLILAIVAGTMMMNNQIPLPTQAAAGDITTVVGGGAGDGALATNASLNQPQNSVFDIAGNLYIADTNNNRIRKVDAVTQIITTVAGTGVFGFSGDGGQATSAQLRSPYGVAIDSAGNLYIADRFNQRIRKVDTSGIITTVAGDGTSCIPTTSPCGDGGPATSAFFLNPQGVVVDSTGNLYIADRSTSRIRKVDAATQIITTVAGTGNAGYNVGHDGGPATSADLNHPRGGVAVDSDGNLYIADTANSRIRKVDTSGIITTVAGTGGTAYTGDGGPATSAQIGLPSGVAIDGLGNLHIADAQGRIRKVDAATQNITTVAGGGFGDGSTAINANLSSPKNFTVDSAGNFYIAHGTGIRKVDAATQIITTVAGSVGGPAGFSGDGGPATSAQLSFTLGVAVDSAGNLYIADAFNHRIRKVDTSGIITTVAGDGTACWPTTAACGDGGPATGAQLRIPVSVVVDGAGNLYIADGGNARIRKVDTSGIITTVAGTGVFGFSGDGGPATSAELFLTDLEIDGVGNLYIADQTTHRIRKVDTSGIITTVAGNGSAGFSGDGGPATSAAMNVPLGVAVDSAGNLYIADSNSHRIRKVDTSGIITTVAGTGVGGFSGDGGPATSAQLFTPRGVAVDSAGNLYITDAHNDRIRKVEAGICANSVVEFNESCDDGNIIGGDGCSAVCQIEDADGDGVFNEVDAQVTGLVGARTGCSDLSGDPQAGTGGDPLKACMLGADTVLHFINSITKNLSGDTVSVVKGADGSSIDVVVDSGASGNATVLACDDGIEILVTPGSTANIACGASVIVTAKLLGSGFGVRVLDSSMGRFYDALIVGSRIVASSETSAGLRNHSAEVLPEPPPPPSPEPGDDEDEGDSDEDPGPSPEEEQVSPWKMVWNAPGSNDKLTEMNMSTGAKSLIQGWSSDPMTQTMTMSGYEETIPSAALPVEQTYFGRPGTIAGDDYQIVRTYDTSGTYNWNLLMGHDTDVASVGAYRERVGLFTGPSYTDTMLLTTDPSQELRVSVDSGQAWNRRVGLAGSNLNVFQGDQLSGLQEMNYFLDCTITCKKAVTVNLNQGVAARDVLLIKTDAVTGRHAVQAGNVGSTVMPVTVYTELAAPTDGQFTVIADVSSSVHMASLSNTKASVQKLSGLQILGEVVDLSNDLRATYTQALTATYESFAGFQEIEAELITGTLKFNGLDVIGKLSVGKALTAVDNIVDSAGATGDKGTVLSSSPNQAIVEYSTTGSLTTNVKDATNTYVTDGGTILDMTTTSNTASYGTLTSSGAGNPLVEWTTLSGDSSLVDVSSTSLQTLQLDATSSTSSTEPAPSYTLSAQITGTEVDAVSYTNDAVPAIMVAASSAHSAYYLESMSADSGQSVYRSLTTRNTKTLDELQFIGGVSADESDVLFEAGGRTYRLGDSLQSFGGAETVYLSSFDTTTDTITALSIDRSQPAGRASLGHITQSVSSWEADFVSGTFAAPEIMILPSGEATEPTMLAQEGQTHDDPGTFSLLIQSDSATSTFIAYDFKNHRIIQLHGAHVSFARESRLNKIDAALTTGSTSPSEGSIDLLISSATVKALSSGVLGSSTLYSTPRLATGITSIWNKDVSLDGGQTIHTYTIGGQGRTLANSGFVTLEIPEDDDSGAALSGQRIVQYSQTTGLRNVQYQPAVGETQGLFSWTYPLIISGPALSNYETDYQLLTAGNMDISVSQAGDLSTAYVNNGQELSMSSVWHQISLVSFKAATGGQWTTAVRPGITSSYSELTNTSGSLRVQYGLPSSPEESLSSGQIVLMNAQRVSTTQPTTLSGLTTDRYYLGIAAEDGLDFEASVVLANPLAESHQASVEVKEGTFLSGPTLEMSYLTTATHGPLTTELASKLSVSPSEATAVAAYEYDAGRQTTPQDMTMLQSVRYPDGSDVGNNPQRVMLARYDGSQLKEIWTQPGLKKVAGVLLEGTGVIVSEYDLELSVQLSHYQWKTRKFGTYALIDFKDVDNDSIADILDECPNTPGTAQFVGCPAAVRVSVQLIDTTQKTRIDQALETKVFDANSACVANLGTNSPLNYQTIFDTCTAQNTIITRETNSSGNLVEELQVIGVNPGSKFVMVASPVGSDGNRVYLGFEVTLNSGDQKDLGFRVDSSGLNFRQMNNFVLDSRGIYHASHKQVIQGSILEIVSPQYSLWSNSEEIYPFVFISDSNWEVDVCLEVPEGYQIISPGDCSQSFVNNEMKVIEFMVYDIGSPPPHVKVKLKVKGPKGKTHALNLDVPGKRKGIDKARPPRGDSSSSGSTVFGAVSGFFQGIWQFFTG